MSSLTGSKKEMSPDKKKLEQSLKDNSSSENSVLSKEKKMKNIIDYLERVQMAYIKEPQIYDRFLKTMQEYSSGRLTKDKEKFTQKITQNIRLLFSDHLELFEEFLEFLPSNSMQINNNIDIFVIAKDMKEKSYTESMMKYEKDNKESFAEELTAKQMILIDEDQTNLIKSDASTNCDKLFDDSQLQTPKIDNIRPLNQEENIEYEKNTTGLKNNKENAFENASEALLADCNLPNKAVIFNNTETNTSEILNSPQNKEPAIFKKDIISGENPNSTSVLNFNENNIEIKEKELKSNTNENSIEISEKESNLNINENNNTKLKIVSNKYESNEIEYYESYGDSEEKTDKPSRKSDYNKEDTEYDDYSTNYKTDYYAINDGSNNSQEDEADEYVPNSIVYRSAMEMSRRRSSRNPIRKVRKKLENNGANKYQDSQMLCDKNEKLEPDTIPVIIEPSNSMPYFDKSPTTSPATGILKKNFLETVANTQEFDQTQYFNKPVLVNKNLNTTLDTNNDRTVVLDKLETGSFSSQNNLKVSASNLGGFVANNSDDHIKAENIKCLEIPTIQENILESKSNLKLTQRISNDEHFEEVRLTEILDHDDRSKIFGDGVKKSESGSSFSEKPSSNLKLMKQKPMGNSNIPVYKMSEFNKSNSMMGTQNQLASVVGSHVSNKMMGNNPKYSGNGKGNNESNHRTYETLSDANRRIENVSLDHRQHSDIYNSDSRRSESHNSDNHHQNSDSIRKKNDMNKESKYSDAATFVSKNNVTSKDRSVSKEPKKSDKPAIDKNGRPGYGASSQPSKNMSMYQFPYRPATVGYQYGHVAPFLVHRNSDQNVFDDRGFYSHMVPPAPPPISYVFQHPTNGDSAGVVLPYQIPAHCPPQFMPVRHLSPMDEGSHSAYHLPYPMGTYDKANRSKKRDVSNRNEERKERCVSSVDMNAESRNTERNLDNKDFERFNQRVYADELLEKRAKSVRRTGSVKDMNVIEHEKNMNNEVKPVILPKKPKYLKNCDPNRLKQPGNTVSNTDYPNYGKDHAAFKDYPNYKNALLLPPTDITVSNFSSNEKISGNIYSSPSFPVDDLESKIIRTPPRYFSSSDLRISHHSNEKLSLQDGKLPFKDKGSSKVPDVDVKNSVIATEHRSKHNENSNVYPSRIVNPQKNINENSRLIQNRVFSNQNYNNCDSKVAPVHNGDPSQLKLSQHENEAFEFITTLKHYLNINGSAGSYEEFVNLLHAYQAKLASLKASSHEDPKTFSATVQSHLLDLLENVKKMFNYNEELFNFVKEKMPMLLNLELDNESEEMKENNSNQPYYHTLESHCFSEFKDLLSPSSYSYLIKCVYMFNEDIITESELLISLRNITMSNFTCYMKMRSFLKHKTRFSELNRIFPDKVTIKTGQKSLNFVEADKLSEIVASRQLMMSESFVDNFIEKSQNSAKPLLSSDRQKFRSRDYIDRTKPVIKNYFQYSKNVPDWQCSGETYYHKQITNRICISEATVLKPDEIDDVFAVEGFCIRNSYASELDKVEEERFEFGNVLDLNMDVFNHLKQVELVDGEKNKLEKLNENGMKFFICKALHNLYGDQYEDIIHSLYLNPMETLNIILPRFLQKQKEWLAVKNKCERKWRTVTSQYYLKSLDYLAPVFKTKDIKRLKMKPLLKDIDMGSSSSFKDRDSVSLFCCYTNLDVINQVSDLILYHAKRQSLLDSNQKTLLERLVKFEFLSKFFDLKEFGTKPKVIYCNDELYTFFRLHHILCERYADMMFLCEESCLAYKKNKYQRSKKLKKLKLENNRKKTNKPDDSSKSNVKNTVSVSEINNIEVLIEKTAESFLYMLDYDHSSGKDENLVDDNFVHVQSKYPFLNATCVCTPYSVFNGSFDVQDYKNHFVNLVQNLLDKVISQDKFEDECRYNYGLRSYICFTFEKLIQQIVKQLNSFILNPKCQDTLALYSRYCDNFEASENQYLDELHSSLNLNTYFRLSFAHLFNTGSPPNEYYLKNQIAISSPDIKRKCKDFILAEYSKIMREENSDTRETTPDEGIVSKTMMASSTPTKNRSGSARTYENLRSGVKKCFQLNELSFYTSHFVNTMNSEFKENCDIIRFLFNEIKFARFRQVFLMRNLKSVNDRFINFNYDGSNLIYDANNVNNNSNIFLLDLETYKNVNDRFQYSYDKDSQFCLINLPSRKRSAQLINTKRSCTVGFLDSLSKF